MSTPPAGRPELATDDERTLTILVVEPDAAVAELLRTLLNTIPGWGVTVVRDAAAALEVARHVRVELLVVDVHLPGISGLELLDLWRASPAAPRPPVVLTTSAPPSRAGGSPRSSASPSTWTSSWRPSGGWRRRRTGPRSGWWPIPGGLSPPGPGRPTAARRAGAAAPAARGAAARAVRRPR